MNLAVVDAGGNLVADIRVDGAGIGSIDISINKAFTARWTLILKRWLAENAQLGCQFFSVHASNVGRVVSFAGGIPLQRGDQIVGLVSVATTNSTKRLPRPLLPHSDAS